MSAVPPPHLIGSVLQSEAMQRRTSQDAATEEARRAAISRELTAVDKAVEVEIEATDADTRVHTDAGGQGGYGWSGDEGEQGATPPADEAVGPNNEGRLDIEA